MFGEKFVYEMQKLNFGYRLGLITGKVIKLKPFCILKLEISKEMTVP
jgi:hypothetical protein